MLRNVAGFRWPVLFEHLGGDPDAGPSGSGRLSNRVQLFNLALV